MEQLPEQDSQQPVQSYNYQQNNTVQQPDSHSWITEDISEPTGKIYKTGNRLGQIGIIVTCICTFIMFVIAICFPGYHSSASGGIDAAIAGIGVLSAIGLPVGVILVVISSFVNIAKASEVGFDLSKRLVKGDLPYRSDVLILDTDDFVIDAGGLNTAKPKCQVTMLFSYIPAGICIGKKVAIKKSHFSDYLFGYSIKILSIEHDSKGYCVTVVQPTFEEIFNR